MASVAVKRGQDAIANAAELSEFYRVKARTRPVEAEQIRTQMRALLDRVVGGGIALCLCCRARV